MKYVRVVAILGALTLAVPAAALAQTSSTKTQKSTAAASTKTTAAKKPPTASAKGVIKSTDATTLVIAHSATKGPEQTFVLDSSTVKHGDLTVGATADVKYRVAEDGKKVATVVTVEAKKGPAKSKSAKKSGK